MNESQFIQWRTTCLSHVKEMCVLGLKNDRDGRAQVLEFLRTQAKDVTDCPDEVYVACDERNNPPNLMELGAICYIIQAKSPTTDVWFDHRILQLADGREVVDVVPATWKLEFVDEEEHGQI